MSSISRIRIIYILGDGRSGSTLLESVLNASDSVVSVGECFRFWERFYPAESLCGCGQRMDQCKLWSSVHESLAKMPSYNPFKIRKQIKKLLLFKNFGKIEQLIQSSDYAGFQDIAISFYKLIAGISGKQIIIDSSKSPSWARVLESINQFEVYFLHMERNLPDVTASWRKRIRLPEYLDSERYMPVKSTANAVRTWVRVKILSNRLRGPHYRFIDYEDFCNHHETHFRSIYEFVKLDAPATFSYHPNHGIAGNPMRLSHRSEPIVIMPSVTKRPENMPSMTYYILTWIERLVKFFAK